MYLPKHFEETRVEVMHALMAAHPLGLLVSNGADGLQANSIPFMVDPNPAPNGTLIAHVARANPLWREAAGTPVLVVFQGPQAYVSPSGYASKAEHGKVVPPPVAVGVSGSFSFPSRRPSFMKKRSALAGRAL